MTGLVTFGRADIRVIVCRTIPGIWKVIRLVWAVSPFDNPISARSDPGPKSAAVVTG
jgi:hypothetical protein